LGGVEAIGQVAIETRWVLGSCPPVSSSAIKHLDVVSVVRGAGIAKKVVRLVAAQCGSCNL